MIVGKYYRLFYVLLFFHSVVFTQNEQSKKDSIKTVKLDEVVIKGENRVMSVSKKLFTVGVINKKDIQALAANNLADMLNYDLNISIIPDASTGRSTVSMFGLDGQYVKILLDGIPITSDNGFGNNIDITQINLEDVDRIEIVEGSMGVLYGDNAVAGVINIISKKDLRNDWTISTSIQEETVGSEYALFDKGRHIQNFKVNTNVINNLSFNVGVSRNDFAGFFNNYKGKNYFKEENGVVKNDEFRGTEWNPKEQLSINANAYYSLKKHNIHYKFQHYNGLIDIYNRNIITRVNPNGFSTAKAKDKKYDTYRFLNNLNINGTVFNHSTYSLSFSYQTQKRYFQEYIYNIKQKGIEKFIEDRLNQSSKVWYSKGFINNLFNKKSMVNTSLGYEFNGQKGYDAIAAGSYSKDIVENVLNNYDFFGVIDVYPSKKFSIHPGFRYTNNSQFGDKVIWQFAANYKFDNGLKIKSNFGSAFRPPNFSELFFYFVDANHNVRGNPNLNPEDGISMQLNLDKKFALKSQGVLKSAFKSYYFDIDDKIANIVVADPKDGRDLFTYGNVGNKKIVGFSLNNTFRQKKWKVGLGLNYRGESSRLYKSDSSDSDFLWGFDLNSNLSYTIPKISSIATINLKYNGAKQVILRQDDNGKLLIGKTSDFTLLDTSFKTKIFRGFEVTLGARNLFDVTTVNRIPITSNHGETRSSSRLFGYGRSYYLKLLYNINLN